MNEVLKNININVGYDIFNSEKDYAPNLNTLEMYDEFNSLKNISIDKLINNSFKNFTSNSVNHFYEKKIRFIYPIVLFTDKLFINYDTIELNEYVIKSEKIGLCRIVFFFITEGYFGHRINHITWLNSLSKKYNFKKENLIVVSGNLNTNKKFLDTQFTIYEYPMFLNVLIFLKNFDKTNPYFYYVNKDRDKKIMFENKTIDKKYRFLCLTGYPRIHRLLSHAFIKSNPELNKISLTSLGGLFYESKEFFYNHVTDYFKDYDFINKEEILNFYKNYDSTHEDFFQDGKLEKINVGKLNQETYFKFKAKLCTSLNEFLHQISFINVVSETFMEYDDAIFFSEKSARPLYMCQPFIIIGTSGALNKLKEFGYKTFNNWWDESYDNEKNSNLRLIKILKLIEDISKWDNNKCKNVLIEMQEILIHNYKTLLSLNQIIDLYEFLKTDNKIIEKKLL